MPLSRIDVIEGRSPDQLRLLLDVLHRCVVEAFEVPERDRFQVVTQHRPGEMVLEDVGLGFERSDDMVLVQITTTPRTLKSRKAFYALAADRLQGICGLDPRDLMINMVTASESDWSFGMGRAQFLTGEL